MRRGSGLLLLASLLLAASGVTVAQDPPRVVLATDPDDVDHVKLYQSGLAAIELRRTFTSAGGESVLVVPLPPAARLDSLQVDGDAIRVHETRSTGAQPGSPRAGDRLVVHVAEGAAFQGDLVSREGGALVLATDEGITVVPPDHTVAVEIVGRAVSAAAPGTVEVLVRVDAPPGIHDVRVSYLAFGAGWTPSYVFDADTGALAFYATLTGLDDWRGVTLDLVSGEPRVVSPPQPLLAGKGMRGAPAAALAVEDVGPSVPIGSLHVYRYERPLDVARGETVRLLVEAGSVEVLRNAHVVEAAAFPGIPVGSRSSVDVVERIEIRNTLGEPLPAGRALVYRNGTWTGEDLVPSVARGERTNLTIATSMDVPATLTLENVTTEGGRDVYAYALTVENAKSTPIDLRALLTYPIHQTTVVSTDPPPTLMRGGEVAWDAALAPDEAATFRLAFATARG